MRIHLNSKAVCQVIIFFKTERSQKEDIAPAADVKDQKTKPSTAATTGKTVMSTTLDVNQMFQNK